MTTTHQPGELTMYETNFGPEYLADYADRLTSNDDQLGAQPFRQMAKAWDADKAALQAAHDENTQLQLRLNTVAAAVAP